MELEERPTTLAKIDEAIHACRRCPIGLLENQAVMGEGPKEAELMIVGEQPGDQEDLAGRPFIGPAGRLLDGYLERAGIDRRQVYLTNAVKHFKFVQRGVLGKTVSISKLRGHPHPLENGSELWATIHPSYLLRLKDEMKAQQQRMFQADLAAVAERLAELTS